MVDQIRLGKLAEKYPRLNIDFDIFGYLTTIIFNRHEPERVEEAFVNLEAILSKYNFPVSEEDMKKRR